MRKKEVVMKCLNKKEKEKLDKEAQVYKCLFCDADNAVRWNGETGRWECLECGHGKWKAK